MRLFQLFLFFSISLFPLLSHANQWNIGTTRIKAELSNIGFPIRVFYPTKEPAAKTRFGPWLIDAVQNAEPREGTYPLIIVSHGLGGNEWNHHLLASRLVEAGFVVAAVHYPRDLLRVGNPEHMVLRPLELSAAINAVLQDARFQNRIDVDRIGAFGFSLGGFTVLASAGGRVDYHRIADHCGLPERDPEYCIGEDGGAPFPLWLRARRSLYSIPEIDTQQDVLDRRIKAIAIAAPLGQPFNDLTRVTLPVMLIRAGKDMSLRHPFHAEHIHGLLPLEHSYIEMEDLHHYAFLSPFPETISSEVGEAAIDPAGFNRGGFLDDINSRIVEFFVAHLGR